MAQTVAFEIKCYEGDWQFVTNKEYLRSVIANCQHRFNHRVLYLNNFTEYGPVVQAAEELVAVGVVDEYCVVEDHATSALKAFDLTRASFNGGYYYSIAELVGIYRCKSDYLLHFSGDSQMEIGAPSWVRDAMQVMERRQMSWWPTLRGVGTTVRLGAKRLPKMPIGTTPTDSPTNAIS